jgi:hypothetical protein
MSASDPKRTFDRAQLQRPELAESGMTAFETAT